MDGEAHLARLVHGIALHGADAETIARSAGFCGSIIVGAMTCIEPDDDSQEGALPWQAVLAALVEALEFVPD